MLTIKIPQLLRMIVSMKLARIPHFPEETSCDNLTYSSQKSGIAPSNLIIIRDSAVSLPSSSRRAGCSLPAGRQGFTTNRSGSQTPASLLGKNGMHYRKEKLESLIGQLLSKEIVRTIETPDALITIINVSLDDKLETAKVYVEIFPDSRGKEVKKELKEKARALRHFLVKKINIRKVPDIVFK